MPDIIIMAGSPRRRNVGSVASKSSASTNPKAAKLGTIEEVLEAASARDKSAEDVNVEEICCK